MKNIMPIIISIVITAIISSGATYAVLNIKEGNNETKAEVRVDIDDDGDESSFEMYELNGSSQTGSQTDTENRVNVEIKSARITTKDDKPAVIITYVFTHYGDGSDDTLKFSTACYYEVYQNGVALEGGYSYADNYDCKGDEYAEVKPGYTGEIEQCYYLNDTTTDLVVEVTDGYRIGDLSTSRTFYMK